VVTWRTRMQAFMRRLSMQPSLLLRAVKRYCACVIGTRGGYDLCEAMLRTCCLSHAVCLGPCCAGRAGFLSSSSRQLHKIWHSAKHLVK
jgi:hypothetical protein